MNRTSSLAPAKWWQVYPQGTQRGSEESKFFRALCRNPKHEWRSAEGLAKETGLTKTRVEEIISDYAAQGMVIQSDKNPEHWGYWEIVKPELAKATFQSITDKDKEQRVIGAKAAKAAKP